MLLISPLANLPSSQPNSVLHAVRYGPLYQSHVVVLRSCESADTGVAFSCGVPHGPLAVGVRNAADWLMRTPGHCAGPHSPSLQGLDGEDNESLQDPTNLASPAPFMARSSCRPVRSSPLGEPSVDRPDLTELQTAVHSLLTEESLALQDAASARGGSLSTIADSLPAISRAVSERCAEIAHSGGSQQSFTQPCQSPAGVADTCIGAPCTSVVGATRRNQRPADSFRCKLCSIM